MGMPGLVSTAARLHLRTSPHLPLSMVSPVPVEVFAEPQCADEYYDSNHPSDQHVCFSKIVAAFGVSIVKESEH